jgi:predicted metal-dependent phosphoesterase TrpH
MSDAADTAGRLVTWRPPWALPGKWYRGVLHVHTTESDGSLEPAAVLDRYREQKYDFVAVTDHATLTDTSAFSDDSFLTIPSIEFSAGGSEVGGDFHIVGIGVNREPMVAGEPSPQAVIDAIRAAGGEAILAHPYWSGVISAELLPLQGYLAVEVYNAVCQATIGKGLSAVHWDDLLARGRRLWGVAVDDAHWRWEDHGKAWIVLKARRLTQEAVMQSLRDGHFYATRGPRITGVEIFEGAVRVTCSAVETITFLCDNWRGRPFPAAGGGSLSRAEYTPRSGIRYVRVECTDRYGRTAWSNPIYWEW